jgi:hypothetical protein
MNEASSMFLLPHLSERDDARQTVRRTKPTRAMPKTFLGTGVRFFSRSFGQQGYTCQHAKVAYGRGRAHGHQLPGGSGRGGFGPKVRAVSRCGRFVSEISRWRANSLAPRSLYARSSAIRGRKRDHRSLALLGRVAGCLRRDTDYADRCPCCSGR